MSNIQELSAYICENYPYPDDLSKSRLTKLIYLADWYSALIYDDQITNINWHFNHYGPYVEEIFESIARSPYFNIKHEYTIYGTDKFLVEFTGALDYNEINPRTKSLIDAVINDTKKLYYNDFIDYVYSTFPVTSNQKYSDLNLVESARHYKNLNTQHKL